jgi:hypothetical protein
MADQNYLLIQENIVTNIVYWNGDANTWQPPSDATMLVLSTTPTKVWELNAEETEYVLTDFIGNADIGFTWDGTFCITNNPKPEYSPQENIPTTTLE